MSYFNQLKENLKSKPKNWLITGVSGFIGSNLLEALLLLDQNVIGIDNFSTGTRKNLDDVKLQVADQQWKSFEFIDGDVCDFELFFFCFRHKPQIFRSSLLKNLVRNCFSFSELLLLFLR